MEEDIKILEEMLSSKEPVCNYKLKHQEIEAISNLLTRYKQLEIENQSYKDYYGNPPCYDDAKYIPKSKVKEKIEELTKEANYRSEDNPKGRVHFIPEPCDYQIQALKDLIEGGD